MHYNINVQHLLILLPLFNDIFVIFVSVEKGITLRKQILCTLKRAFFFQSVWTSKIGREGYKLSTFVLFSIHFISLGGEQ